MLRVVVEVHLNSSHRKDLIWAKSKQVNQVHVIQWAVRSRPGNFDRLLLLGIRRVLLGESKTYNLDRFRSVYNNDLNIYKNIESLLYRSRHVPDSVAYILDEVSRLIILFGTGLLLRSTSKVQINTVSAMLSSGHLKQ